MQRACVLIGVKKTGELPVLQAVEKGIRQMEAWARSQQIDGDRLVIITDEKSKVRVHQIVDAIEELVTRGNIEQLIVYFSGHGIHNRGDLWLLSDAPAKSGEAVNVEGSIQLARYCGIPHVVLISDACRTAADGIAATGVTGTEIFPNDPMDGKERAVDAFFACARGKPALEVKNPNYSASGYAALYTEVFASCLSGQDECVIDTVWQDGAYIGLVRALKVADRLEIYVPQKLKEILGKAPTVNQTPVARITSRDAWLARVAPAESDMAEGTVESPMFDYANAPPAMADGAAGPSSGGEPAPPKRPRGKSPSAAPPESPRNPPKFSRPSAASPLDESARLEFSGSSFAGLTSMSVYTQYEKTLTPYAQKMSAQFGPLHYETTCGFKIQGARVKQVVSADSSCSILDDERSLVRVEVYGPDQPPASILLIFENDCSALVPAIPGFITGLRFEGDELVQIDYEPSDNTARWQTYQQHAPMLRELRGSIAAAAALGVFQLTSNKATELMYLYQFADKLDPTIALYAAYAFNDLGKRHAVQKIQEYLLANINMSFFDIAMLATDRATPSALAQSNALPMVPMLSQGWSLIKAFGIPVSETLLALQPHVLPSLWTLFDSTGTAMLQKILGET
jgi:Caspase domain